MGAGDIVCGDGSVIPAGVICASGGSSSTLAFSSFLTGSTFGSFSNISLMGTDLTAPGLVQLDQDNIAVSGSSGELYLFSTQEFDFGLGGQSGFTGAIDGTTDGIVNYEVFVGTSAFSLTTQLLGLGFGPGGADMPFSGSTSGVESLTGTLWLTQIVHVSHLGSGMQNTSSNATIKVTQVPEPGTLSLLGAGLLGFGMMRRRLRTA